MSHFLAIHNYAPSVSQKYHIASALKAFDPDLHCIVGSKPGQAAFYVEAPDYYGRRDEETHAKCEAVCAIVTTHMGAA